MGLSIPTTYLVYIPSIPLSSNCIVVKHVCACALVSTSVNELDTVI